MTPFEEGFLLGSRVVVVVIHGIRTCGVANVLDRPRDAAPVARGSTGRGHGTLMVLDVLSDFTVFDFQSCEGQELRVRLSIANQEVAGGNGSRDRRHHGRGCSGG